MVVGPVVEQNGTVYHMEDAMGKTPHYYCQNPYAESTNLKDAYSSI